MPQERANGKKSKKNIQRWRIAIFLTAILLAIFGIRWAVLSRSAPSRFFSFFSQNANEQISSEQIVSGIPDIQTVLESYVPEQSWTCHIIDDDLAVRDVTVRILGVLCDETECEIVVGMLVSAPELADGLSWMLSLAADEEMDFVPAERAEWKDKLLLSSYRLPSPAGGDFFAELVLLQDNQPVAWDGRRIELTGVTE